MATTVAKTLIATGASSGIGFELIKHLLTTPQPYNLILGARSPSTLHQSLKTLNYDTNKHTLTVLPLDLSQLQNVKTFAASAVQKLGEEKWSLDYVLLNAGISKAARGDAERNEWCESYVVNHLAQHYLMHLLRGQVERSAARVVFVSSGVIRNIKDTSTLEGTLKANSGADFFPVYAASKFTQLLGAHYWRRQLSLPSSSSAPSPSSKKPTIIAVSPGLVPNTGLGRYSKFTIPAQMPDAISVPQAALNILRALEISEGEFPEDPQRIFLTSWGEWWEKEIYALSLDEGLQEKWCLGREEIEGEVVVV